MTQIKRDHAAIAACVVAGAFMAGGALSPIKPTKATDCNTDWMGQVTKDVQQAIGGIQEPAPSALDGYYDVRQKRDVQLPQQAPVKAYEAPQSFNPTTPMPPVVAAPVAAPRNSVPRDYQGAPPAPTRTGASAPISMDAQIDAGIFEVNSAAECVGVPAGMRCQVVAPIVPAQGGENVAL